jgi:uncharacterized protein YjiS (DUF1127 family)
MDHAITENIRTSSDHVIRPLDALHSFWSTITRWRRKRKAIAELHFLSDRSLADIGLARSDIESSFWCGAGDATRRRR